MDNRRDAASKQQKLDKHSHQTRTERYEGPKKPRALDGMMNSLEAWQLPLPPRLLEFFSEAPARRIVESTAAVE